MDITCEQTYRLRQEFGEDWETQGPLPANKWIPRPGSLAYVDELTFYREQLAKIDKLIGELKAQLAGVVEEVLR